MHAHLNANLNVHIHDREIEKLRPRYKAKCKQFDYQIMWFAVETHNNHFDESRCLFPVGKS